jgi:hypothetical protein
VVVMICIFVVCCCDTAIGYHDCAGEWTHRLDLVRQQQIDNLERENLVLMEYSNSFPKSEHLGKRDFDRGIRKVRPCTK